MVGVSAIVFLSADEWLTALERKKDGEQERGTELGGELKDCRSFPH